MEDKLMNMEEVENNMDYADDFSLEDFDKEEPKIDYSKFYSDKNGFVLPLNFKKAPIKKLYSKYRYDANIINLVYKDKHISLYTDTAGYYLQYNFETPYVTGSFDKEFSCAIDYGTFVALLNSGYDHIFIHKGENDNISILFPNGAMELTQFLLRDSIDVKDITHLSTFVFDADFIKFSLSLMRVGILDDRFIAIKNDKTFYNGGFIFSEYKNDFNIENEVFNEFDLQVIGVLFSNTEVEYGLLEDMKFIWNPYYIFGSPRYSADLSSDIFNFDTQVSSFTLTPSDILRDLAFLNKMNGGELVCFTTKSGWLYMESETTTGTKISYKLNPCTQNISIKTSSSVLLRLLKLLSNEFTLKFEEYDSNLLRINASSAYFVMGVL